MAITSAFFITTITSQLEAAISADAQLTVSATILDTCVVTPGTLQFSEFNSSGASNATTELKITCSNEKTVTVNVNEGANVETSTQRRMKETGSEKYIKYNLFSDNSSTKFPKTVQVSSALTPVTIFGEVTAAAHTPGTYTDTVIVTLEY